MRLVLLVVRLSRSRRWLTLCPPVTQDRRPTLCSRRHGLVRTDPAQVRPPPRRRRPRRAFPSLPPSLAPRPAPRLTCRCAQQVGRATGDVKLTRAGEAARMLGRPMGVAANDRSVLASPLSFPPSLPSRTPVTHSISLALLAARPTRPRSATPSSSSPTRPSASTLPCPTCAYATRSSTTRRMRPSRASRRSPRETAARSCTTGGGSRCTRGGCRRRGTT